MMPPVSEQPAWYKPRPGIIIGSGWKESRYRVPELPEVETVVRDLRRLLVGRRIVAVRVGKKKLRRRWSAPWGSRLTGRLVAEVRRRGKWIWVVLDGGQSLVIHLGMTGQLRVMSAEEPRVTHTHLVFDLDHGEEQLRYSDVRRFGSATLFAGPDRVESFFRQTGLGPEPFGLDARYWKESLMATRRCVKAVLLDQRVVAGVGNIYADEALFEARLHPARPGRELTVAEAGRLRRAMATVLTRAIEKRGSSIRNYLGGSGLKGQYQEEFRAYGRTGRPCPRCRTLIRQIRLAGRSTHFCPRCQRGPQTRRRPL
jgi:formamidopyrimidine-DNA glycosylase